MSTIEYNLIENLSLISNRYRFRSDHGWMRSDPDVNAIAKRGMDLLPTLVFLMNARGDLVDPWLVVHLLTEITGEQPWPDHKAGDLHAVQAAWSNWAIQHGIRNAPVDGRVVSVEASAKLGHVDLLVEDADGCVWRYYGCFPIVMRENVVPSSQLSINWKIEF